MPSSATLGRYAVARRIGRGGFADVFLGRDAETGRQVALKVLRDDIEPRIREQVLTRFFAEESIARAVEHPAVVQILETSSRDQHPCFIAMDYIDGLPFCEHFLRLRVPDGVESRRPAKLGIRAEVFRLGHQVARAISVAHQRGIVHRDLKPDNVLVVSDGESSHVRILDFGIAKAPAELFSLDRVARVTRYYTELGTVMGSPPYMAPEQNGAAHSVSGKADVYALGVMLLVALANLDADALETGREHLSLPEDFETLVRGAGLSDPVRGLLRRMVDEKPEARPTMHDAALGLQRAARSNERFGAAVERWLRHGRVPGLGELLDFARYGERAPHLTEDERAFIQRAPLDKLAQVRSRARALAVLLATGLSALVLALMLGTARALPNWPAIASVTPAASGKAEPSPDRGRSDATQAELERARKDLIALDQSWTERETKRAAEHKALLQELESKLAEQRRSREQAERQLHSAEGERKKSTLAAAECRSELGRERDALAECRMGVESGLAQLVETSERLRLCTRNLREQSQSLRPAEPEAATEE